MNKPVYQAKAEFFKVLGHPARIQVLEVLRSGERSVSALVSEIGIESSHLSQQLGILRRASIVQTRKEGSAVFYSVVDRNLYDLFDVARRIITSSLAESLGLLDDLRAELNVLPNASE